MFQKNFHLYAQATACCQFKAALDYQHLTTYDIKVQIEIAIFPKN